MADLATLQARLTEAEAAYHQLVTGVREVEVQHDTMRVKYTQASAGHLAAYITSLRAQIAAAGGASSGSSRRGLVVDL